MSGFSARTMAVLVVALQLFGAVVFASDTLPPGESNPELEAQVQRIAQELRCLVCQNQTIADSNAELARDLRREVRRMLKEGSSEQQVREFMVQRYGDFVLYRPPVKATTVALWVGPFALLLLELWIARRILVSRRRDAASGAVSRDEQERLQALVKGGEPGAR